MPDGDVIQHANFGMSIPQNRFEYERSWLMMSSASAQEVCDRMVAAGIRGILNFAPAHLRAPNNVVVRHEDFAVSLALLAVATERTEHAAAISADLDK